MSTIKNGFPTNDNIFVKWCPANSTAWSDPIKGGDTDASAPPIDAGLILQAIDGNGNSKDSYLKILSINPKDHGINVVYKTSPKVWVLSLEGVASKCTTNVNVEIGP